MKLFYKELCYFGLALKNWKNQLSNRKKCSTDKLTRGLPSRTPTPCLPERVSACPWRSLEQNRHRQITTLRQVWMHSSDEENLMTHALTADDVQHALGDVGTHVKSLGSDFLLQLSDQGLALLREHFHEAVQDLEVEGRCDHLPVGVPFLSW